MLSFALILTDAGSYVCMAFSGRPGGPAPSTLGRARMRSFWPRRPAPAPWVEIAYTVCSDLSCHGCLDVMGGLFARVLGSRGPRWGITSGILLTAPGQNRPLDPGVRWGSARSDARTTAFVSCVGVLCGPCVVPCSPRGPSPRRRELDPSGALRLFTDAGPGGRCSMKMLQLTLCLRQRTPVQAHARGICTGRARYWLALQPTGLTRSCRGSPLI